MKQCPRCDRILDDSSFYRSARQTGGLGCYCRACSRDYKRERKQANAITGDKRCLECSQVRSITHFPKSRRAIDGRMERCLSCRQARSERQRKASNEKPNPQRRRYQTRNAQIIAAYKSRASCSICGESRTPCLEFHHRDPMTKRYDVSTMGSFTYSAETIHAEIAKCVIVCANCHRLVHAGLEQLPS